MMRYTARVTVETPTAAIEYQAVVYARNAKGANDVLINRAIRKYPDFMCVDVSKLERRPTGE
jgi:hypothetical protein